MNRLTIDIGRLSVTLHGVSATAAEAVADGLEAEIRRRLGALPWGDVAAFDIAELSLGRGEIAATGDAAAVRGLIADRLVQSLSDAMSAHAGSIEGGA